MNNEILRKENVQEYIKRNKKNFSNNKNAYLFSEDDLGIMIDLFKESRGPTEFISNLKKRNFSEFKLGAAYTIALEWAENAREMKKEPVIGYV